MNHTRIFLFTLFWASLLADCILIFSGRDDYRIYTKPLLSPLLLVAVYAEAKNTKDRLPLWLVTGALFCCFAGDVILLDDQEPGFFISGLISFVIAHILFITFFYRLNPFSKSHPGFTVIIMTVISGYLYLLLSFIWQGVGAQNLKVPVLVYAIIMGMMLLTAFRTVENRTLKRLAYRFFIPGATMFVISDSVLAVSKFSVSFHYSSVPVMLSYATAIFLFANGAIRLLRN